MGEKQLETPGCSPHRPETFSRTRLDCNGTSRQMAAPNLSRVFPGTGHLPKPPEGVMGEVDTGGRITNSSCKYDAGVH